MKEGVIILLQARPEEFDELSALVAAMTAQVRAYPGNLQAEVLLARDRNEISVFQQWESAEALSDYLIWRSGQEDFERVHDLAAAEPDFRTYTIPLQDQP
ncbi:hypothetical protein RA19_20170 [Leisingera sp. ANG-M1]|nr:hypothetical protein RA19_20170 [Leisingera sp. ANG-M1]